MTDDTSRRTGAVKVHDRRRFTPDGPVGEATDTEPQAATGQSSAPPGAVPETAEVERLRDELAAAKKRVDELARAIQAGERDREEYKQRIGRERERLIDVERGNVATALLEAIDELELCLKSGDTSPLAKGVALIRDSLVRRLESSGVQPLSLWVGGRYNPNEAEAVDVEVTTDPSADQTISAVVRAGYVLKGTVIRPARVKVARYIKPAEA